MRSDTFGDSETKAEDKSYAGTKEAMSESFDDDYNNLS